MPRHAIPFQRLKRWLRNPDRLAILGLLGLLAAFYPELFLVKAAPLTGDHLEQHYPWAYQLAQSLKEFKLPFWTPLIHCGFPLVAESQIGAFYIPNLLMYFFLPFQTAYAYMNLVHWFIAGWGTYLYAKQMKLGPMPAFVAAIIFTFGSAYGGAYYNMTSLKTICWFPVALYFLERYFEKEQRRFLIGAALLIGQSIVAGYMQMAALTWMIFGVYAVIRIFLFPEGPFSWAKKAWTLGALAVTALVALILAFPQIFLTYQLAVVSNRTGLEEGYAYVGSLSPLALGTLINPGLLELFRGNNLYAGSFSLFLILFAFFSPDTRKSRAFILWSVMTLLALLLALGQWSPLYVALIRITKFYSFRVPAKFLGFICFGLAMLSAAGFQGLWQGRSTRDLIKKTLRAYVAVLVLFAAFMAAVSLLLTIGKGIALKIGEYFVMHFVFAKPGHPHSLKTYLSAVEGYANGMSQYFSFNQPVNMGMIAISLFCVLLIMIFLRKKNVPRFLLGVSVLFLAIDLYTASFLDEQREFLNYKKIEAPSPVLEILEQEKAAGRLGRIYGFRSQYQRLPLVPSQNMLYGIEDIGAYSPLVSQRYYQTIGLFGNINDSNFAVTPTPAFVTQRLPLLDFLNVSHILSTEKLIHPDLDLVFADPGSGVYLYAIDRKHSAAFFMSAIKIEPNWETLKRDFLREGFDPTRTLLIERSEFPQSKNAEMTQPVRDLGNRPVIRSVIRAPEHLLWDISVPEKGFFVLPDFYDRGWKATVSGRPATILRAFGLFRAIAIENPGSYRIEMRYHPQ